MRSSYISDNIQNLIDRLNSVNSITGIASIIDMCHEAASYISNMETYRYEIYCHTEAIKHQLDRIIK